MKLVGACRSGSGKSCQSQCIKQKHTMRNPRELSSICLWARDGGSENIRASNSAFFLKNVSLNSNMIWHVVTCQAFGDLNWFLDDPVCTGPRIYRANGEENLTYDELLSHHGGCLKDTKRTFLKSFTHCFREAGLYFSCHWSAAGTKLSSILIERVTDPRRKKQKNNTLDKTKLHLPLLYYICFLTFCAII